MKFGKRAGTMLALLLLLPPSLDPQIMPPQPGKLNIYSQPNGAVVSINGQKMQQHTNASFVVSPGTYTVSVTGSNPSFTCPAKQVQVGSGQTITMICSSTKGWQ
jgi:hypothetical protein